MLLNDLPDDCLLIIFNSVDNLDNLINFSKVCSRWNLLIKYRLNNVKYALELCVTEYPKTTVYMEDKSVLKEINSDELLPNLKILEIQHGNFRINLEKFAISNNSIIGLIYHLIHDDDSFGDLFPNIEMVVTRFFDPYWKNRRSAIKLKQIYIKNDNFDSLSNMVHNFENLERLHLDDHECLNGFYEGPKIPSLKILELLTTSYDGTDDYTGFHFMDFCPSLTSAFFYSNTCNYVINESIKNENLKDLALDHLGFSYCQRWGSLRRLLRKFPNLENLAIRSSDGISDENIKELIEILPNIKLMDFRTSPKVTSNSAEFVRRYCKSSGRSIKIYYDCEGSEPQDWPKMVHTRYQIVEGSNFMAHCFFRGYYNLPLILYPNDNCQMN